MSGKKGGVSEVSQALCELANLNNFVGSKAEGLSLIIWYLTPGKLGEYIMVRRKCENLSEMVG